MIALRTRYLETLDDVFFEEQQEALERERCAQPQTDPDKEPTQ